MKLKVLSILLTLGILVIMWYNSPLYEYRTRPTVKIITPKQSTLYNSIIVKGNVEEGEKSSIRLEQSAKIEKINVSLGDKVSKGEILFCTSDINEPVNIEKISNILPEINSINDIKNFYIPKTLTPTVKSSPNITSPSSGIITQLDIKEGAIAMGMLPIATVSNFDKLLVRVPVSELYIKEVKIGQEAEITGEAFKGKKYNAVVYEISPVAKQKTSLTGAGETTVDVLLEITSKNTDLKPGYTVNTKILTEVHENALSLPYNCIIQEGNTEYVFVLKGDSIRKTAIKTGFELETVVEIKEGISKKDKIVSNPNSELIDNALVKAEVD